MTRNLSTYAKHHWQSLAEQARSKVAIAQQDEDPRAKKHKKILETLQARLKRN